jgi:hypothetical protein
VEDDMNIWWAFHLGWGNNHFNRSNLQIDLLSNSFY